MSRKKQVSVGVPIEIMDALRLVVAAAVALVEHPGDQVWLDRLTWAVDQLPASERTYFGKYAMDMVPS